ncbi:hypothetical protein BDY19DRAFT_1048566 [Irpex rosettiformis]|uniref:Uncharacterized protein n=1 Tax=Irpex rosettiformis TaxID=378272 RepID=A0ACB8U2N8_9APHY|nr:hypothetical protein BDY19DRAFT_1048566 [Irpex rosettiformis]
MNIAPTDLEWGGNVTCVTPDLGRAHQPSRLGLTITSPSSTQHSFDVSQRHSPPSSLTSNLSHQWWLGTELLEDSVFQEGCACWVNLNIAPTVNYCSLSSWFNIAHLRSAARCMYICPPLLYFMSAELGPGGAAEGMKDQRWTGDQISNMSDGTDKKNESIAIVTILWAVNIEAPIDANGTVKFPPTSEWVDSGIVVAPKPFSCRITPRFPDVQTILAGIVADD